MKNYAKLTYAKITDGIARQRIITYACYAIIIATAILSSAISMTFGLEAFNPSKFAFNLCMSLAIGLTALLLSMRDGEMVNDDRKSGDYYEAKQDFKSTRAKIIDVGFSASTPIWSTKERGNLMSIRCWTACSCQDFTSTNIWKSMTRLSKNY